MMKTFCFLLLKADTQVNPWIFPDRAQSLTNNSKFLNITWHFDLNSYIWVSLAFLMCRVTSTVSACQSIGAHGVTFQDWGCSRRDVHGAWHARHRCALHRR